MGSAVQRNGVRSTHMRCRMTGNRRATAIIALGERTVAQEALFYEFNLERHVPANHLLRSIDPELMIRMLIVGFCFGIRSERRLCDEVHLSPISAQRQLDCRRADVPDVGYALMSLRISLRYIIQCRR